MSDTEEPDCIHNNNGKITVTAKGEVVGGANGVQIEVNETGTSIRFTTDNENTSYKKVIEDYKRDTYKFIRSNGNPKVTKEGGRSSINISLDKIKK